MLLSALNGSNGRIQGQNVPKRTALSQLREQRDAERRLRDLLAGRDELIRDAVKGEGHPERLVAEVAGLSHARVHQIVHSR
jgi:hypothetical protein